MSTYPTVRQAGTGGRAAVTGVVVGPLGTVLSLSSTTVRRGADELPSGVRRGQLVEQKVSEAARPGETGPQDRMRLRAAQGQEDQRLR